jgi:hypothetical protein
MTRISAVFILTLLSVLGVVGALLLPSAAQADCAHWDIGGHWVITQHPYWRGHETGNPCAV